MGMRFERPNLDRRIQFRRAVQVDDGLRMTEVWSDHGTPVWARKSDISDSERWRAASVQATITTRFIVRYSSFTREIGPRDRLTCKGREYNIIGVKEVGPRQTFLEITGAAEVS